MTTRMVSWSDKSTRAVFAQPPVGQVFARPRKLEVFQGLAPIKPLRRGKRSLIRLCDTCMSGSMRPHCAVGVETRSEECDKPTNEIFVVTNRYPNVWHPFFLSPWRPYLLRQLSKTNATSFVHVVPP
jgi:hypothetical protein